MNLIEMVSKKSELIAIKKATNKLVQGGMSALLPNQITKGVFSNSDNAIKRTIIGNTYLWMDSHDDVHAKGVFKKSISERKDIFHLHDHEYKLTAKVGEPIKIYEDAINWKDLGVDKSGETQALFMDSEIFKGYNERIFNDYLSSKINQHSVGMGYVQIDLAVNDEEFEEEYKLFNSVIDLLGNKQQALDKGYFWYVKEAKLFEISAVLMGSNSLTPTINEPTKVTQITEPPKSTQNEKSFYSHLI